MSISLYKKLDTDDTGNFSLNLAPTILNLEI
jgi:hypothetical protein